MKRLFAISILILLVTVHVMAQDKIDCGHDGLVGRVKTVAAGSIAVEGTRLVNQETSYNERCDRTEMINYGPDGKTIRKLVYTYDEIGRNTGFLAFSGDLKTPSKHTYVLDGNGRIVEYTVFERDGSIGSRFTYEYDAKGNKVEDSFYTWMGTRGSWLVYTYDEAGHQLTTTCYGRDDLVSWKMINSYDAEGRLVERNQYEAGLLRYRIASSYDSQGRVAAQETFEFNRPPNLITSHAPVPGKVIYAYDDANRTREVMTYSPLGNLKSREIHTTDARGKEISTVTFDENGSIKNTEVYKSGGNNSFRILSGTPSIRVEYDSQGNWTKKTRLIWPAGAKEAESYSTEYRTITYF